MKLLFLALAAAVPIFAQPACITVSDTPYSLGIARPVLMNGTIDLSLGYTATDGSFVVTQSGARITVTNGVLQTCLAPGNYIAKYAVKYSGSAATTQFNRYWTVPATGGPYTLKPTIESDVAITPTLQISFGQLPAPPASGTFCIQSVNGVIGWNECSGGGGGLTLSGLTNGTLASLTNSTLLSLTN